MLVISSVLKKIELKAGIDFSNSLVDNTKLRLSGDFSNSNFAGLQITNTVVECVSGIFDHCNFSGLDFDKFKIRLQGPAVPLGTYSFKGANFTGALNFPFAAKINFLEYFSNDSVDAATKWIDGTSILD